MMQRDHLAPDNLLYTVVLLALAARPAAGIRWQLVSELLTEMRAKSVTPNVKVYSSAVATLARSGLWQLAVDLLRQMAAARGLPDVIAYNSTISVCEKSLQWRCAIGLLADMCSSALVP